MSDIFYRVILKMILENIVPCVKLIFTTLVILNSIGYVLSQHELDDGLNTDCLGKRMKKIAVTLSKAFRIC